MSTKQLNDVEQQRDSEAATLASPTEKKQSEDGKLAIEETERPDEDDNERKPSNKGKVAVTLDPHEDPKNFPLARKWLIVLIMSSAAFCTTCTSSIVRFSVRRFCSLFLTLVLGCRCRRR